MAERCINQCTDHSAGLVQASKQSFLHPVGLFGLMQSANHGLECCGGVARNTELCVYSGCGYAMLNRERRFGSRAYMFMLFSKKIKTIVKHYDII